MSLQDVLGQMIAGGMGGRTDRGRQFLDKANKEEDAPAKDGGTNWKKMAGIAALAYLGYRAMQDGSESKSEPETKSRGSGLLGGLKMFSPEGAAAPRSFGQRLRDFVSGGGSEPSVGDQKALLLIRGMIAAANSDGQISADERQAILSKLEAANATAEDRRTVEAELKSPKSIDSLLPEIKDEETAEQFYLASRLAVRDASGAQRDYLNYLAGRLNLPFERRQQLDRLS